MNKPGGKRKGAGRPCIDTQLVKVPVSYRLPQWLVTWLRNQKPSAASIIETAVCEKYNLKKEDYL